MNAKLISRVEDHTFTIQLDHEMAHYLFCDPCNRLSPDKELELKAAVKKAGYNFQIVETYRSLISMLREIK